MKQESISPQLMLNNVLSPHNTFNPPLALTYDDVLLRPRFSTIASRRDADTSTKLTNRIKLNIPVVSANMDTVTESAMAIAMARMGGIGIIHRFISIQEQAEEVTRVKNAGHWRDKEIYTISQNQTLAEAWQLLEIKKVSSLLVVDKKNLLVGILTARDISFEDNPAKLVRDLMTSGKKLITGLPDISLEEAQKVLTKYKIEKLPLISKKGRLVGLATAQDVIKEKAFKDALRDSKGRFMVGAAIGVRGDWFERAQSLVKAGVDVLVLDIAHGHSQQALNVIREVKNKLDVDLIAGNVATYEGARDLAAAGADAIKVGIGPGSACTTRIVAGIGVPQFTAITQCASALKDFNIPLVADGGIRMSGDIVKALAAGASSVMLGNLLAGCKECPGETVERDGKQYKVYRGMASAGASQSRIKIDVTPNVRDWLDLRSVPEGVEAVISFKGSVTDLVHNLVGGLRSGMSYLNSSTVDQMPANADFIQITGAGLTESHPHDLIRT